MRILHVGKYFPPLFGGIENFLSELVAVQSEQGHDVTAVVHAHDAIFRTDVCALNGVQKKLYRVPSYGRILYAPVSPSFPWVLWRAISVHKPEIIHLHVPNTSAFSILIPGLVKKIPFLVHWHADVLGATDNPAVIAAYRLYQPFERKLLQEARAIIATSPTYRDASRPLDVHRDKTIVVPLGLGSRPDSEIAVLPERVCWPPGSGMRLLAVGRATYYKGYEYLIDAVARVPGVILVIVGAGEGIQRLRQLARTSAAADRIKLVGGVSPSELQTLYRTCDAFCLPSTDRAEAFGMVLIEAMSHGKPTITSDIPGSGTGWVVRHDETGILVPPADARALAVAIEQLRNDDYLRSRLGNAGYRRYLSEFTMSAIAGEVESIYNSVLAGCR